MPGISNWITLIDGNMLAVLNILILTGGVDSRKILDIKKNDQNILNILMSPDPDVCQYRLIGLLGSSVCRFLIWLSPSCSCNVRAYFLGFVFFALIFWLLKFRFFSQNIDSWKKSPIASVGFLPPNEPDHSKCCAVHSKVSTVRRTSIPSKAFIAFIASLKNFWLSFYLKCAPCSHSML